MCKLLATSLLIVLSVLPPSAHAQHTLSTLCLIERVANEKEPTCKLAATYIRKSHQENYAYLTWRCGEQDVRVDVNEYDSIEDARITPTSLMTAAPRRGTRLKGIGDEAYLLGEGLYAKGKFNVIFRKGTVRMDVTAQSSMAQRFARHFADSLGASQRRWRGRRIARHHARGLRDFGAVCAAP